MEVAALKQRAAGSSTGQSGQSEGTLIALAPEEEDLDRTAAQLAEQDKANKVTMRGDALRVHSGTRGNYISM